MSNDAAGHDTDQQLDFTIRKWVRPEHLNANGTLFGGVLLQWIDEEAAIFAVMQLGNDRIVTKYMSEINFEATARQGNIIEMAIGVVAFGRTSITLCVKVRNMITRKTILSMEKIVFVNLDENGTPQPHGYSERTSGMERLPKG